MRNDGGVRLVLHGGRGDKRIIVLSSQQGVRLTLHNVAFFEGFRFTFVTLMPLHILKKKKKRKNTKNTHTHTIRRDRLVPWVFAHYDSLFEEQP